MHFADVLARDSFTASFELFPPKAADGWEPLFRTIADLDPLKPSFVSVTYGAGGSTRRLTHDLVVRIRRETRLDPVPHLACIGHAREEVQGILERYADAGVSNILALRGDRPAGTGPVGDYAYASELVAQIVAFNRSGRHRDARGFGIGVAGYPEGHPETPNTLVQMDHLKAKVDAGADVIFSQLFFDNAAFMDWRDRCELAGIRIPIIPGIMPITSMAGVRRMAQLAAGTRFPAPLLRALRRAEGSEDGVAKVGIHWATEQCRDLIDRGVRGIHFYTLNRSDATRRIYENLGVRSTDALRA